MGGADGAATISTAAAAVEQFHWRRTPITSGGGHEALNNGVRLQNEFGCSLYDLRYSAYGSTWNYVSAGILEEDWNRLQESPIKGCEDWHFKELIRVYPKKLDWVNVSPYLSPEDMSSIRRMYTGGPTGGAFTNGPVFRGAHVDVSMFDSLLKLNVPPCRMFRFGDGKANLKCSDYYRKIALRQQRFRMYDIKEEPMEHAIINHANITLGKQLPIGTEHLQKSAGEHRSAENCVNESYAPNGMSDGSLVIGNFVVPDEFHESAGRQIVGRVVNGLGNHFYEHQRNRTGQYYSQRGKRGGYFNVKPNFERKPRAVELTNVPREQQERAATPKTPSQSGQGNRRDTVVPIEVVVVDSRKEADDSNDSTLNGGDPATGFIGIRHYRSEKRLSQLRGGQDNGAPNRIHFNRNL